MKIEEFVQKFAEEFDETPIEKFTPKTIYKELEEWNSLNALSIIAMIDDEYQKTITGADLRKCSTIEELFNFVKTL